jgi:hypothetical protein
MRLARSIDSSAGRRACSSAGVLASRPCSDVKHVAALVQRRCELCADVLSAVQTEAHFWAGCPALWAPRDRLLSEVDALYPGFAGRYGQLRTHEAQVAGLCVSGTRWGGGGAGGRGGGGGRAGGGDAVGDELSY